MKDLIIKTKTSKLQSVIEFILTLLLWGAFFYWLLNFVINLTSEHMWLSEVSSRLALYFLAALVCSAVLVAWAIYNKIRFRHNRRRFTRELSAEELATSHSVSENVYAQLQNSRAMQVHFNKEGEINKVETVVI